MNVFDVLLIVVLQNLEQRITSVERKTRLLQFGIDLLPHTHGFSRKLKLGLEGSLETALHSVNLLDADEDASSVKTCFEYNSEYLMRLDSFDSNLYTEVVKDMCVPDTVLLNNFDIGEVEDYNSQKEFSHSMEE